jgi:DNA mismatch repair protein MutS
LKIRWNNVFGYSIEITNTHRERVPVGRYQRKQTLANAERYVTDELVELERKVVTAQDRRLNLEESIFQGLARLISSQARAITEFAAMLAELDVVTGHAVLAREENYVRPNFTEHFAVLIKASRHPVVEQLSAHPFIANDIVIQPGECLLLTGPNMAGKSTLMRQVAVTQILAQIGSYVPAEQAELPILERVLTRIGASDALAEGLSTFMVEMKETAELLAEADEKSLVVLDEIGRGTSTFDGMALAQAILEHLLTEKQCLTLFATHYHELTELEVRFARLRNAHMAIHEKSAGEIVFLHRLVSGPATESYGIAVARLAGLSPSVTRRAAQILKEVELSLSRQAPRSQLSLFDQATSTETALRDEDSTPMDVGLIETDPFRERVIAEISSLELERLTPLDAFLRLVEWRRELSSKPSNLKT